MSDVFISYSRKDIAFARLLHEALQAGDVETWIDWARIPVGEKWWDEICDAISQAGVFLFIISKNSVGSEVCKKEIDQALSHNKRIIPVIVDETSVAAIEEFVPDLTAISWIIFKQDEVFQIEDYPDKKLKAEEQFKALPKEPRFQKALEKLNNAIHTDWAWVKAHTRLETRALEWDRQGQEASLLLRGKDLREAEERLEKAAGRKDLQPTELQKNYIQSSRLAEKRRQRVLIGGIAVAVIAAAILGYFVWNRSQAATEASGIAESEAIARSTAEYQAQQQQATAQAENIRAEALRLSTEAENLITSYDGDSELALLLSIRSLNLNYNYVADRVLSQVMVEKHFVQMLGWDWLGIKNVVYSPDGKYILTGDSLWDVATKKVIHTFSDFPYYISRVEFSSDGNFILIVGQEYSGSNYSNTNGSATIWDAKSYEVIKQFNHLSDAVFSPDNKSVFIAELDSNIKQQDIITGSLIREYSNSNQSYTKIQISPNNQYLIVGGSFTQKLFNVETGEVLNEFQIKCTALPVFSPDGKYFLTALKNTISLWDSATGNSIRTYISQSENINYISFSPDGKKFIATSNEDNVSLWSIDQVTEIRSFSFEDNNIYESVFSPDGKYLLISMGDNSKQIDIESGAEIYEFSVNIIPSTITFSPDSRLLLTGDENHTARLWDAVTGEEINSFSGQKDEITATAFSQNSQFIATASKDGTIMVYDSQTADLITTINTLSGTVNTLTLNTDGSEISFLTHSCFGTRHVESGEELSKSLQKYCSSVFNSYAEFRYSPDKSLLLLNDNGFAQLIDVESGNLILSISDDNLKFSYLDFSSDGNHLFAIDSNNAMRVYSLSGIQENSSSLDVSSIRNASYSSDKQLAVIAGTNNDIVIFDITTGVPIREFRLFAFNNIAFPVSKVLFSPDKNLIATSTSEGVLLFSTDYRDMIARACSQLTRDLTPEERTQYGITDDTPTCETIPTSAQN